jgi:hypothetical protein
MTDQRKIVQTLFISNLALMFGFQVWRAVFNNLAVEDLDLQAGAVGAIQSIRELPGLMGFLFVAMMLVFGSEMRVMGANVIILGLGLIMTGVARDLLGVVLGTVVTSIGFHYFSSGSQAVLLQVTAEADAPRALGVLSSVGALAAVIATIGVFGAALVMGNRQIMLVGGIVVVIAGVVLLPRMNIATRLLVVLCPDLFDGDPPAHFFHLCHLYAGPRSRFENRTDSVIVSGQQRGQFCGAAPIGTIGGAFGRAACAGVQFWVSDWYFSGVCGDRLGAGAAWAVCVGQYLFRL